jgi:Mg-chelatase subunit ChlD
MSQNLQSLFQNSQQSGMSRQSVDLLVQNLDGQTGLGCVGAQIDSLNTDDVTLLSVLIDASGSMGSVRADVIDAFNQMARALADSKARDSILMSAWTFSDKPTLLFGYTPIDSVKDLTKATYAPNGATALYDAAMDAFTGIVAYGQELRNGGIRTRCIVVVITDGGDNMSSHTAAAVKTVALDLLKQEFYTLAFIGMGNPNTFNQIASNMGFPSILTVGNSATEIRRALNMVSGSVIRASQTQISASGSSFFTP